MNFKPKFTILDGNGRTARLLSTLCLYRKGFDFQKLFTISEYYDKNRQDYYAALQSVRQSDMDMTKWLEYFVHGLASQMQDIRSKGEVLIQTDIVAKQNDLTERQSKVLHLIVDHSGLAVKELEELSSEIPRRTLQRELKMLVDKGLIFPEGSTNNLIYRIKD